MKRELLSALITVLIIVSGSPQTSAQDNSSVAVKKFEIAPEFTTITFESGDTQLGLGGRLTYNVNRHFALEFAGYFFPHNCEFCGRHAGQAAEGLFGVKVGKRFQKWGIFGKARPGLISFSEGQFDFQAISQPATNPPSFSFTQQPLTALAVDLGGVLEFYPSKRIITRFDFGSTIIHYGRHTSNFPVFDPVTGDFILRPSTIPSQTRGTFQIMAGVGFRF